jgi:hypothetical protein
MTTSLVPPLGATGTFTVSAPFTAIVSASTTYECMATRYLAELIKLGIDPFAKFYQQAGITPVDVSVYQADLAAGNVAIVALKDSADSYVYVPSTFITGYPNPGGIPYTPLILGIDIGAIPDVQDLSSLKTQIINLVNGTLGITTTVQEIQIGKTQNLSQNDHNALQAARQANITNSTTDRAKYLQTLSQLVALQSQYTQLANYVKANLPPPPPAPAPPP